MQAIAILAAMHKDLTYLCDPAPKQRGINGFKVARSRLDGDFQSRNGKWFAMPRYYFNTRIADELISDPEGEQLRDPDQAWEIARAMIRELLKLEGAEGGLLNATLEVTDDAGEIVLEFPFTEAILDMTGEAATRH